MRLLLLLAVTIAVVTARLPPHLKKTPPCSQGGVCTAEDLASMSHDQLRQMVQRLQGQSSNPTISLSAAAEEETKQLADDKYWWVFQKSDCPKKDVPGSCAGKTVDECKAICLATKGCVGFNTHGYLKSKDCWSAISYESTALYVLRDTPQAPQVWPQPASWSYGSARLLLNPAAFKFSGPQLLDLNSAFARSQSLFFPHAASSSAASNETVLTGVSVSIVDLNAVLDLGVDESYTMTIDTDGSPVQIHAQTVFGVYHALQTLSQLIEFDFDSATFHLQGAPWKIDDKPRFPHRELLIDSSRHFLPLPTIKRVIDGLSYIKMNTIHWHIVDSQSFPFGSLSNPQLAAKGAWSSMERYTPADVAEVVEYARQRGIRIMPELDVPGHAASWCLGDPSICPDPQCPEPLDPSSQHTFDVVASLQSDLAKLFPDVTMHLGGDEVDTTCWKTSDRISNWMKTQGMTPDTAYLYFVNKAQASARALGKNVVGWEELWKNFGTSLDPNTIIHQWLAGSTVGINATNHGYRLLWSTSSVWYLDWLATTWETMYDQEPCSGITDDRCAKYVLGGGGEMWGETVDTSDIQATVFPRVAAIAERLWSPKTVTDITAAWPRYKFMRCLLNSRGIGAAPTTNTAARTAPSGPGSCWQ